MRDNTTLHFIIKDKVSDGMGGFIVEEKEGSAFGAFMLPVKRETILQDYGITTSKPYRVVTKEPIEHLQSEILSDGQQKFKVIEFLDLKYKIFLVEVVE